MSIKKGDIVWVQYDPSQGTEVKKRRPSVVLSSNILNENHCRILVAPITSKLKKLYPFEFKIENSQKVQGKVMLDQMRFIDKSRLGNKLTMLSDEEMQAIQEIIKHLIDLQ